MRGRLLLHGEWGDEALHLNALQAASDAGAGDRPTPRCLLG